VVRLDNDSVSTSKCDLSKLKIEHAFTIVKKDKSGRAFYFSCSSEEECSDWVRVILETQGWSKEEVAAYMGADVEVKNEVKRSNSLRPKRETLKK